MEGFLTGGDYERFLAFPRPAGAAVAWSTDDGVRSLMKPARRITVAGPCGRFTQLPFDNIGLSGRE
jgi:hypothetical protein